MNFTKTGIIKTESFVEDLQLSDGSMWTPIVIHNNQKGANMFSSSDDFTKYIFHNSQCWCNFSLINTVPRPASGYEILVMQQNANTEIFTQYRWSQTVSPLSATWSQVSPSSGNITHSDSATYGGMYILNSTVYMCFANSSNGNWFGCAHKTVWGGTAGTDGYTPGYNGEKVYGYQNVYIRTTTPTTRLFKNFEETNHFYEI